MSGCYTNFNITTAEFLVFLCVSACVFLLIAFSLIVFLLLLVFVLLVWSLHYGKVPQGFGFPNLRRPAPVGVQPFNVFLELLTLIPHREKQLLCFETRFALLIHTEIRGRFENIMTIFILILYENCLYIWGRSGIMGSRPKAGVQQ